jgi:anaerobic selenocysteine-containing dehydrogenase
MPTHHRTCNLCEAMCGLVIEHDGARVQSIRADEDDVLSRGHICPKAVALQDIHEDPDRLRAPQRRGERGWESCDWESALDTCAARIAEIQERHGPSSVAVYFGNPTAHNTGALLYSLFLMAVLKTKNRFSATSCDQLPHMLAGLEMFGHQVLMPVPDVDRTDYLLMLGANPIVSGGSIMSAPGFKKRIGALHQRGGRLVVVDPRRTETAALADRHVPIRPGTDGLFLAALVRTLFDEGLARPGRLATFTDGIDELREHVRPFTPEAVAASTGIDAAVIRDIARSFAAAPRAACYGRVGMCTQRFGGLNAWLVNALNVVTGNLDRAGGMMFGRPAVDLVRAATLFGESGHFDVWKSRVRGLPEFGGELPAFALAEEIETPGDGRIRALITVAGNPVLSTPAGAQLGAALDKLDFMVSLDLYRNETTCHAHYILPPTSQLEQGHYDLALLAFAVRNTAKYSPPLFAPPAGAKADWQILVELGSRILGRRGSLWSPVARLARAGLTRLGPEGALDFFLRRGPYGKSHGLDLARLQAEPHGVDLGPLEACLPRRLNTPRKRIRLVPPRLAVDLARLEATLDERPGRGELLLIGRRQLRTNNSWLHNSLRMVKGQDRCTLLMHPDDAAARGLVSGQRVGVRSRVGRVVAPLQLSDAMMRGVVSLPHGFGHALPGVGLAVASRHAGVSVNDLTDPALYDELSGTAALNGVPVDVGAAEADGRSTAAE